MSLLYFVKEDDGVGLAADGLGELAAVVVTDVAGRGTDEAGNIVLFVIIFVFGHTVNIAINLIGTYVHTNRLQYVEFFSKFYEGSGRAFTPLKINSKFFTIRKDEKYE